MGGIAPPARLCSGDVTKAVGMGVEVYARGRANSNLLVIGET
jgi:hypothetical protein